jgi:hypothetical protein
MSNVGPILMTSNCAKESLKKDLDNVIFLTNNRLGKNISNEKHLWQYGDKLNDDTYPTWYRIFRKFNEDSFEDLKDT